jgi:hypothetical protein
MLIDRIVNPDIDQALDQIPFYVDQAVKLPLNNSRSIRKLQNLVLVGVLAKVVLFLHIDTQIMQKRITPTLTLLT